RCSVSLFRLPPSNDYPHISQRICTFVEIFGVAGFRVGFELCSSELLTDRIGPVNSPRGYADGVFFRGCDVYVLRTEAELGNMVGVRPGAPHQNDAVRIETTVTLSGMADQSRAIAVSDHRVARRRSSFMCGSQSVLVIDQSLLTSCRTRFRSGFCPLGRVVSDPTDDGMVSLFISNIGRFSEFTGTTHLTITTESAFPSIVGTRDERGHVVSGVRVAVGNNQAALLVAWGRARKREREQVLITVARALAEAVAQSLHTRNLFIHLINIRFQINTF